MTQITRNNGLYTVLYENDEFDFLLVKYENHDSEKYSEYGEYSFGNKREFESIYFFPVEQSCLKKEQAIERLNAYIMRGKKYIGLNKGNNSIKETVTRINNCYKSMIEALKAVV